MTDNQAVGVKDTILDPLPTISMTGPVEAVGTLSFALKFPFPEHRDAITHCLKFYLVESMCDNCNKPHWHMIVTFYNDDQSIVEVKEDNAISNVAEYRTLKEAMEAYKAVAGKNQIHVH